MIVRNLCGLAWGSTPVLAVALVVMALPDKALAVESDVSTSAPKVSFGSVVSERFQHWDRDSDGVLVMDEIDAVVADRSTTGPAAAAIAAIKRAARSKKLQLPPLTRDALLRLEAQGRKNAPATAPTTAGSDDFDVTSSTVGTTAPRLHLMYGDGLRSIARAGDRKLYAKGEPHADNVKQGKLGNCFSLAPLGAMVHKDPARVARMIQADGEGTYRVTFGKKTVKVTEPTDAEIALSSSNAGDGIWVNVYEKALGTAQMEDAKEGKRARTPLDALASGGSAGTMLAYITGTPMRRFSFKYAKDPTTTEGLRQAKLKDLREQLTQATKLGRLMTCGTGATSTSAITPNHAYAVLGYDSTTDRVRLWNPHGQDYSPKSPPGPRVGYPTKDGVFEVPLNDFTAVFSGMAFEEIP